jgi:3-oxoacyl-[acyl-carrier-protein] synthase III
MPDVLAATLPLSADARLAARGTAIAAVSKVLPAHRVPNAPIAARLGVEERWIVERTGILERRIAADGETLTGLATAAGAVTLARANLDPAELDLVLVATFTQDEIQPNAAPQVASALGAREAGAIDLGAACTGFIAGLSLAAGQVGSGQAEAVLVIAADLLSRVTDRDDRSTAHLFGDGAGAALVVAANGSRAIGPTRLRSDGAGAGLIWATWDRPLIGMEGREVYKHAVKRMSEVTVELVAEAEWGLDDIDLFVYHQANARILRAVGERLNLPAERVYSCIERYGNTSAASMPIALTDAEAEGRLRPGMRVLLASFGAGFSWGGALIEWGGPNGDRADANGDDHD